MKEIMMKKERRFTLRISLIGLLILSLSLAFGGWTQVRAIHNDNPSSDEVAQIDYGRLQTGKTPLQQALQEALEARQKKGLPTPSVVYDYAVAAVAQQPGLTPDSEADLIITGRTVLEFDNPQQAGLDEWPAPVVADHLPAKAEGFVAAGDYSDAIQAMLAQKFPGIWDRYEFGYEPRRYTFKETYKINYPAASSPTLTSASSPAAETVEEIVMGFTETGPGIEYIFEEEWEECIFGICVTIAEVKAGLDLDWDIGLRLPLEVSLTAPDDMIIGSNYALTSTVTPLDWSAEQFEAAGIEGEDGNEFVLKFVVFLGVQASIIEIDAIDWAIDAEYDGSASFTTPLGPGTSFPLPSLELSPDETGLEWDIASLLGVGIGLTIDPSLSQSELTAEWLTMPDSNATGSGMVEYIDPATPATLGPVTAGNPDRSIDEAHIRLMAFQYGFDQFSILLRGALILDLFGYDLKAIDFDIFEYTLDDISGGPWLEVHEGTNDTVDLMVPVIGGPPPIYFIYLPAINR